MRSLFAKISVCLIAAGLIFSCSTAPIQRWPDCAKSLIYDAMDSIHLQPDVASRFLQAGLLVAIKEGLMTPGTALKYLDELTAVLDGASYQEIYMMASQNFAVVAQSKAGEYIQFLFPLIPAVSVDRVISKCDEELMLAHLEAQKAMIRRTFGL